MVDLKIKAILSEVDKVDSDYDIILAGAFDEAINEKFEPPVLFMHRRGEIVGQWSNLKMEGKLLKADGVLYTDTDDGFERAKMAAKLIKTNQLKGVSIGFRPTEWKSISNSERPYGWDIEKLDLKEASLVDVPANDSAKVTELKQKYTKDSDSDLKDKIVFQKFYECEIEIVEDESPQHSKSCDEFLQDFANDVSNFIAKLK